MDAEKFPITTPYGQVPGYELNNGWHRGEDRAMPMDTPILVNGVEIGLSGNTGRVTGPHLHIGRFVGGGDTAPNGGGFHFNHAVVTEISQDATNGKFVRLQADGASWVYLHLSRQSVPVGQELVRPATSPATPPTPASYTVVETYPNGKQIRLNKDTNLWGMNYHFDFMVAHPVETDHKQGEIWTVTNKVHHEDGYDYYRRDGQVDGFNVLDCDDYVEPAPYVPPAPPVAIPKVETYTLLTTVMYFNTAENAKYKKKPVSTLKPGEYIVVGKSEECYRLVKKNMDNESYWINTTDNVAEPEPTLPPKMTEVISEAAAKADQIADELATPKKLEYAWLRGDRKPVYFHTLNVTEQRYRNLENLDDPEQAVLPPNKNIQFSLVTFKGGMNYYIPTKSLQNGKRHGIPETMLHEIGVTIPATDTHVRTSRYDVNGDGDVNISDFIDYGGKLFKSGVAVVSTAAKTMRTKKMRQFIDGFSKPVKKEKVK